MNLYKRDFQLDNFPGVLFPGVIFSGKVFWRAIFVGKISCSPSNDGVVL